MATFARDSRHVSTPLEAQLATLTVKEAKAGNKGAVASAVAPAELGSSEYGDWFKEEILKDRPIPAELEEVSTKSHAHTCYDLPRLEERAWMIYLKMTEKSTSADSAGSLRPESYSYILNAVCKRSGVMPSELQSRMGGILSRYIDRWVRYISVQEIFGFKPHPFGVPRDLDAFGDKFTQVACLSTAVKENLERDFPDIRMRVSSIMREVEGHYEPYRQEFAFSGKRTVLTGYTNLTMHLERTLGDCLQRIRLIRDAYLAEKFSVWASFKDKREELYCLRMAEFSMKKRFQLDLHEEELGADYLTSDQFLHVLKSEGRRRSEPVPSLFKMEELATTEYLSSLAEGANPDLRKALSSWLLVLKQKEFEEITKKAPIVCSPKTVVDLCALVESKKDELEVLRSEIPLEVLTCDEAFMKRSYKAKSVLSDIKMEIDAHPSWYVEQEDRSLQVATAITDEVWRFDEDSLTVMLEKTLSLWMLELKATHSAHGIDADMEGWKSSLDMFESSLLPKYVRDTKLKVQGARSAEGKAYEIQKTLKKVSVFYYGNWIKNHINFQLVMELRRVIKESFQVLPGEERHKRPFMVDALASIRDVFSSGDKVINYLFNTCS